MRILLVGDVVGQSGRRCLKRGLRKLRESHRPDFVVVNGENAAASVNDQAWLEDTFIPTVQQRGAAIIEARGLSSAASAASAAVDHVHDWVLGTPEADWVSMAIPSDGSYGMPEGLMSSFPVTCSNGEYSIVQGLEIDEFSQSRIDATVAELGEERDTVAGLGLI